ncbi:hypothetical protein [Actinocrispum wychmicini]|nr:hypothetical protein [Actinocrispum wychmicini]
MLDVVDGLELDELDPVALGGGVLPVVPGVEGGVVTVTVDGSGGST